MTLQLGCEFVQNMAKFQCCVFGCLFNFYHIPEVWSVDNYKIGQFKVDVWRTVLIVNLVLIPVIYSAYKRKS